MYRRLSPIARAVTAAATVSVLSAGLLITTGHDADASTAPAVMASRSCRPAVTRLPDLGHGGAAVSFSGSTIVGSVNDAHGQDHPAIWRDGRLTVLRTSVISNGEANDINSRGQIVGDANNFTKSWELHGGSITILRDVHGSHADFARRINARGQIAGAADNLTRAARWSSAAARPVLLAPQPADKFSFSHGINDAGEVAGDSDAADGTPYAAVWDRAGHIRVFAGAFGPGSPAQLFVINDSGQSVGESFAVTGGNIVGDEATIWSATGAPRGLGYLPGLNQSTAFGLSGSGTVTGESSQFDFAHNRMSHGHGFIWPGHGDLLTLPVPHLTYAKSQSNFHKVSDNGTVAGTAGPVHGLMHAFVWTCAFRQAFRPPQTHSSRRAPTALAQWELARLSVNYRG